MTNLPTNVYRVAQRRFDAVPGAPWVYWVDKVICSIFETFPSLRDLAQLRQGLATADNFRFLRYWWEIIGRSYASFSCKGRSAAEISGKRWFPLLKGGSYCKWYGNLEHVVNWQSDGQEIKNRINPQTKRPYSNVWMLKKTSDYFFSETVTWSRTTSGAVSVRYAPPGSIFDVEAAVAFSEKPFHLLAVLNSKIVATILSIINPTIHYQIGDVAKLPLPIQQPTQKVVHNTSHAIRSSFFNESLSENTFDFLTPPRWDTGLDDLAAAQARLAALEAQIDDEVYRLYGISDEDRATIEAELAGGPLIGEEDETEHATRNTSDDEEEDTEGVELPMTEEELAVRWISYAVGVILGRFEPGVCGALGSAVYRRQDFAVGSLAAPDRAEFDQLVGPAERFAYVDVDGGRHVFPVEVEAALRDLAVPDGIAVLDEGHPRDLPALVEQALQLMLDWDADTEHAARNTREVVETGAGGDLRKFLEKDFFTRWHLRWYRKRPVYWPLQSAKRSYGFVLFHERVDRSTLYVLQREYLDHKLNGLRLQIGDLQGQAEALSGAARKRVERQMDRTTQQLDEITEFAATMERVVREGYEPQPNWIDDGVILRMAPLWELIPIWKSEPKKYWERLQGGDYDWSHIAMRYWPDRVRERCKANKSYAIAHGHEEWYEG